MRGQGITRRAFAAGTLGSGLILGSGRAPAIAQGKRDLRVGVWGGEFGNLSPVIRFDIQGGLVLYNIFDGLVKTDFAKRTIEPSLALEWTNPDPLTWRIKLREGVKWQKGFGEFTAEDVVYCWNFHIESKSFQVGTALFPVDSVKADGKYVVEVKTKLPFGAFPGVTMGYGGTIISAKAHKEMGNQAYSATPVGNGPFQIESKRGTEITLVKNPDYWQPGLPKLDKIVYRAIPDSTTRLQALLKNELDFVTHPDPKELAQVRKNTNFVVNSTPGWEWDFQQFNLKNSKPDAPFRNKLVRQAISYAIDREAIVKEIYYGEALATDNQIPAGYLGYRGPMLKYPKNGDLKKAKELMAQAGVKGYEVEVITSDKDWLRKELELVAAMVSQIGITYKLKNMDMGGYNNLWLNQRYDQVLEDITLVAPDPDATCWWFLHGKGNASGYDLPLMDGMLDGARSELDQGKREGLYHKIVDHTLEECPLIYHCNTNNIQVFNKNVKGFVPTPQEYMERLDTVEWG
ncbi:ABC transporter substrate-binding protein [Reyranella soli]|uniref:Glutathione ABC transporter substrate-binding protein n=1 Tax=Reyranella soli TaxID=1230389 RepID=A0A512N3R8_9HYPH|nr:ABC transporter substrate-binding protein [Reyranella soli]GEP53639.1 glutathione ABC transporter substrate-binding protein [Reyranella soli]